MTKPSCAALLLLAVVLAGGGPWGCGGTETGNPSLPGMVPEWNEAEFLLGEICRKLASCFEEQVEERACRSALVDREGLAGAFGLRDPVDATFAEAVQALREDALVVDGEALQACTRAIGGLDCEDPMVQAVEVDQGFHNIEAMIPGVPCAEVFSIP